MIKDYQMDKDQIYIAGNSIAICQ